MSLLSLLRTSTVKEIAGGGSMLTDAMYEKIKLWQQMAAGSAPWNDDKVISCGIVRQVQERLHTMVRREMGFETGNDAIAPAIKCLEADVEKIVDGIVAFGSCVVRPIFVNEKLQSEIIPMGNYLPIKYDFDGTLTECVILKHIDEGERAFLLVERHKFDGGNHSVTNTLYRESVGEYRKTSLDACAQTSGITESYAWVGVKFPMIREMRNRAANNVDGGQLPVAIISGAENLIRDADIQYERMKWEMEAGEKRIFIDSDMLEKRVLRNGKTVEVKLTGGLNRLMTKIDGDGSANGEKIHDWSPALRVTDQVAHWQQILRRIELVLNIGKGTISDMESQIQTATQYSGGRQELFAIVDKIEDEIESGYRDCAKIFAYMARAYGLGSGSDELTVTYNDDFTRKDMVQAKNIAMSEISAGVRDKWEYRRDFFGEDDATARASVPQSAEPINPFME